MTASSSRPTPEFSAAFLQRAGAGGILNFFDYMDLALYHPSLGYYRRGQPRVGYWGQPRVGYRVGYGPKTDFFTSSSSGPIFGEMVAAACIDLLAPRRPGDLKFVEIGAEPPSGPLSADPTAPAPAGIFAGRATPFASVKVVGLGEPPELSEACVVFSNELFDAQPFHRFVFRRGTWRELGVSMREGRLAEVEMPRATPAPLPEAAPEGYVIDAPLGAVALLERLASMPWTGLFLAFDYGKSWAELTEATPAGTARAYRRHVQSNDLLAFPGEQDLTCHLCWDWLEQALLRHGFSAPALESQEAFFVRHAASAIEAASKENTPALDPRKRALAQLLHPAHLGQKFQVLHASRWSQHPII